MTDGRRNGRAGASKSAQCPSRVNVVVVVVAGEGGGGGGKEGRVGGAEEAGKETVRDFLGELSVWTTSRT